MSPCAIDGCSNAVAHRNMCHKHYKRWLVHGDPSICLTKRLDGVSLADRLTAYSDRSAGPLGCWPWTRGKDSCGYGTVQVPPAERINGKQQEKAPRAAWRVANGRPVPAGLEVLHSCDNPACINPAHLRVGTHAENMAEMGQRDRAAKGERSGMAKVSDEVVRRIRDMRATGMTNSKIAAEVGLSTSYVSRLTAGDRRVA